MSTLQTRGVFPPACVHTYPSSHQASTNINSSVATVALAAAVEAELSHAEYIPTQAGLYAAQLNRVCI